jgi:hypothetical protein
MKLDATLRAHGFMRIERPPLLWEIDVADDRPFFRLLGELIAHGLGRGSELSELLLAASNVTIEPETLREVAAGDYVALTIRGRGDWGPEQTWVPASAARLVGADLDRAAREAGIAWGYTRVLGPDEGSITVLFPRLAR